MPQPALYTPAVLAAAVRLAEYPLDPLLPLAGEARSRSCGSVVAIRLRLDAQGRIERIGCTARACAIGQAAAALFVEHARGAGSDDIKAARDALARWIIGESGEPHWPGLALLAPARAYPARHGAMLLAWDAALVALDAN